MCQDNVAHLTLMGYCFTPDKHINFVFSSVLRMLDFKSGFSFIIDKKSPSLKLIQIIRNEAHRFAINYHKKRRLTSTLSSALTDIDGIGEKTAELLIKKIGSVRRIYETDLDILSSIIGEKKASLVLTGLTSVFKNAPGEI